MSEQSTVLLFSYGTLQQEGVQLSSFGRLLCGDDDAMLGYRTDMLEITDPAVIQASGKRFHPVVSPSSNPEDKVEGKVFSITAAELQAADAYEVADYKRIEVPLQSGKKAWVYVQG